jgi:hypothetical protein
MNWNGGWERWKWQGLHRGGGMVEWIRSRRKG